jgi:hypothetical protein
MGYGIITAEMMAVIDPFVRGKEVWDFGAGDLTHAETLAALGATKVVAIDKAQMPKLHSSRVMPVWTYFSNVDVPASGIRVAFVAWPVNYVMWELIGILDQADVVIYLGSNTDGNACGFPGLFEHLVKRELLAHVPYQRNSLIVVGKRLPTRRLETPEEVAAQSGFLFTFDDACKVAETVNTAVSAEQE